VLSIYADLGITGFALPPPLENMLEGNEMRDMIAKAIMEGAMTAHIPWDCLLGFSSFESYVGDLLGDAIAALGFPWQLQLVELLSSDKLFCEEPWKTDGFDEFPCAKEIGCQGSGVSSLPEDGVMQVPAELSTTTTTTPFAAFCSSPRIAFGDRFIELYDFRIAQHDDDRLTITHKESASVLMMFDKAWSRANEYADENSKAHYKTEVWERPTGAEYVKGSIKMGFQFIQIGNFRLGADDWHMDPSTPGVLREWKHDRTIRDRAEGPPAGIILGWRFLQIGKFRISADYRQLAIMNPDDSHPKKIIEYFDKDGTHKRDYDDEWLRTAFMDDRPFRWPCRSAADLAFGPCDPSFVAWGDRFVQLGDFRLAAMDENHFSVSSRDGWTAQIFKSDGTLHPGPRRDWGSWDRPVGFPHGITFGRNFLQIGLFDFADVDGMHLTISHINGNTPQLFKYDGNTYPHQSSRDFSSWHREEMVAGPATGVRYGKDFLEIGKFRIGAVRYESTTGQWDHLVVSHGTQTIQVYRDDGLRFGAVAWAGKVLAERPTQSHCGAIQVVNADGTNEADVGNQDPFGQVGQNTRIDWNAWNHEFEPREVPKPFVSFGDNFIELREYSILAFSRDGVHGHLSFGGVFSGPHARIHGAPKGITFGDRFIQIGKFRIGDVDGKRLSVAHVGDESGTDKTIAVYQDDGNRVLSPPGATNTTVGRPLTPCKVTELH
ncbi:unnamed protein product, partial [Symbiodinium necroappetens]